ncbi:MAG: DUF2007 domain-containing protein [Thermoleophilia bacterium]|nr:DUF2007 domain-containing protein [Thermoleophilia bacterium]
MEDLVRVTIVPNEVSADLVCSFLRAEGIKCAHRVTNVAAGSLDGVPGMGGAREIVVAAADVDAARAVLAAAEAGDFEDEDALQA